MKKKFGGIRMGRGEEKLIPCDKLNVDSWRRETLPRFLS